MSTLKRKFELLNRITALGFTFEEAQRLRRISMTLSKWAEAECNGDIERDETSGKPFRVISYCPPSNKADFCEKRYSVADREAGALKRLKSIVDARNNRNAAKLMDAGIVEVGHKSPDFIVPYHQTDPRGCALYLLRRDQLPESTDDEMRRHSGEWPLKSEETRLQWKLSCYYTRGLAVCA